jgi:hypothetical protein
VLSEMQFSDKGVVLLHCFQVTTACQIETLCSYVVADFSLQAAV